MKTFLAILTVALTMTAFTPTAEARDHHYRHHRHHTGFSLSVRPSYYGGYYPNYSYYRQPAYYYSSPYTYSVPAYTSYYDAPVYSYYRRPIYYSRPVVRYYPRYGCW